MSNNKSSLIPLPPDTLVPNHLAIICDGNRRWARARNLPNFMGHSKGFDITPKIARACRDYGIHTLSFWAFSTENWDRSKEEIDFLMKKYEWFVDKHLSEAQKEGVRIIHLGRKDRLSESLVKKILNAENKTKNNTKYVLNIALDYGGRDEIIRAINKIAKDNVVGDITEEIVALRLDTGNQPYPYPDMLIRPSGEQRTSGMFCWQGAYTETYWLNSHFPDLNSDKLREAIIDYSKRRRRFGGNDNVPKIRLDPNKAAKYEVGWWKAHHQHDKKHMTEFLTKWLKEIYELNSTDIKTLLEELCDAVAGHDNRNWQKAAEAMSNYYQIIKEKTKLPFSAPLVAQLEINWWKMHDQLEGILDKKELEKIFNHLYGEVYRLSELQTQWVAYYKTLATYAHDLAESAANPKSAEKYWLECQNYLQKSYLALRQVAS